MYLDTDILLALIKKDDWLKPHTDLKKIKSPKTSVFAVIEAEIILLREHGRENAISALKDIKRKNIRVIPLEEKTLKKSIDFLEKYERLNIFDSVHAAYSAINKEKIVSTDNVFDGIEEIEKVDPRDLMKG